MGKGVLQGYGSYGSQNRTYPCIFEGDSNSVDNLLKGYIKDSICERPYQEGYVECELKRKRRDNDWGWFVYKFPQAVRTYVLPPIPQIEMEDYFIDFSVPEDPWPHVTLKVQATGFERGLIEVTYPDVPSVSLCLLILLLTCHIISTILMLDY